MGKIIKNDRRGYSVAVDEDFLGKAHEHSLCPRCQRFTVPYDGGAIDDSCKIENIIDSISRAFGLAVPVYECPAFVEKKEEPNGTCSK